MSNKLIECFKAHSARLNLFSKGDRELLGDKHIPDSLEFLKVTTPKAGMKILDLGTGGGLPGLVLAEALESCEFTLIDARNKKMEAVAAMAKELDLSNVHCTTGRFEVLAHEEEYREQFDLVVARAVAPLPVLLEYAVGFLKNGGSLYAWKGSHYQDELNDARTAMELLSFDLETEHEYQLPSGETRFLLQFKKTEPTPEKYPREDGKPKKSPLS